MSQGKIAYIAGQLPKRSETFVYREVRALRARGWVVHCVSLHASDDLPKDCQDVAGDVTLVYGRAGMKASLLELARHPWCSARTVATALGDAVLAGEQTAAGTRLKLFPQALAALGVAWRLRRREVQHIHAHFAHAPTTIARYAARQLGVGFSFTGHANDIFQRRALLRRKLRDAAFVACISEWHRSFYLNTEPRGASHYEVVRCGVNLDYWAPAPRANAPQLRVATVCRLVSKKGIDTALRAFASLQRPASFVVAGDGPDREKLEALAGELGCADRVTWLGAVDNQRAQEVMQEADVFILPCRTDDHGDRDGIPVVLMEAMASGLAVMSGDLPSIRELIRHAETGVLLPAEDVAAWTRALEELTPARAQELGQAARAQVGVEFSESTNIARLEQLLEQALNGRRKTTPL